MPTDSSDFMQILEELLQLSRESASKISVMEQSTRQIAAQVDRHDVSLYGRDDKDGVVGRLGRVEERIGGRLNTLEADVKRIYAAGGFVITLIVGGVVARLLNLI